MDHYDVVVMGGGLAGLMAAISAKRHHPELSVMLMERHDGLYMHQQCGEGLDVQILEDVGFPMDELDNDEYLPLRWALREDANLVRKFRFVLPGGQERTINFRTKTGWNIEKGGLEIWMRAECARMGVELRNGNAGVVRSMSRGKINDDIRAGLIIDATGHACVASHWLGLHFTRPGPNDRIVCRGYRIWSPDKKLVPPDTNLFDLTIPGGYGWIFPRGKDHYNVGIGVDPRHQSPIRACFPSAMDTLNAFMFRHDIGGVRGHPTHGLINMMPPREHVIDAGDEPPHVILVGEAGGLMNMPGGAGNGLALASGYVAGKYATEPGNYNMWYRRQLRPKLLKGYKQKEKMVVKGKGSWVRLVKAGCVLHKMFPGFVEGRILKRHRLWGSLSKA